MTFNPGPGLNHRINERASVLDTDVVFVDAKHKLVESPAESQKASIESATSSETTDDAASTVAASSPLLRAVYHSKISPALTETQLRELVNNAAISNQKFHITGILMARNGYFVQVLEGAESDVMALLSRISADERHSDITMLTCEVVDTRRFGHPWLGFLPHSADPQNKDNFDPSVLPIDVLFDALAEARDHSHFID
jgi:hypothetical protein